MTFPNHDYQVYGLRVRSSIPLPGWPVIPSNAEPEVVIRRTSLATPEVTGSPYSARSTVENGELRLGIASVGRYWASGGNRIQVDPEPDARPEDVQLYLTGAVMGAILHQRGLFPLHASCVALDGQGVAIAGPSGAGKSTLVTALIHQGAAFVSDDICVLSRQADGTSAVWPSAARAKLDQAALSALDHPAVELDPAGGNRGKYLVPVASQEALSGLVPLRRLYLLRDNDGPVQTERIEGLEAVAALVEETYFLRWAGALGLAEQCFAQAGLLARNLHVMRLLRPRGFQHLKDIVSLIHSEARVIEERG